MRIQNRTKFNRRNHKITSLLLSGIIVIFSIFLLYRKNTSANPEFAVKLDAASYTGFFFELLPDTPLDFKINDYEKGKVDIISLDNGGRIYVYVPHNYDKEQKYNIIYHQEGLNSTKNNLMDITLFQRVLDNLICFDYIEPIIFVVIPDFAYGNTMSFKTNAKEIIEIVESKYHTYADYDTSQDGIISSSPHRCIGGFSQGAFSTWDIIGGAKDNSGNVINMYADTYLPISPYYSRNWNVKKLIDNSTKNIDRFRIYNTIGENETGGFDGIEQLNDIKTYMTNAGYIENYNVWYYIVQGKGHSQENCATVYFHLLKEIFANY